jgi:CRP-like cAMP-binding protein
MAAKTDPVLEQLARVPLFSALSRRELQVIASMAKPASFPAGTEIVEEGTRGGRFFLITQGQVDVLVNGHRITGLGPGATFGEIALIDEGPRTATVRARSDVDTLGIASFNFRPLLKNEPGVAYKLMVELCRRLREADRMQSV